ncbi:DUF819 family protein [Endozoicomonadaceae bacterium StTr2]
MITSPFSYLSLLMLFLNLTLYCERKLHLRLFKVIPPLVFVYIGGMVGATFHIWELTPELKSFISTMKSYLLPMLLFWLLLKNDIRDVLRLGPQLLGTFIAVSTSIVLGFILIYVMMQHLLEPDAWETFSLLCSSWIGGTVNIAAVQQGLGIPEGKQSMTYTLFMDNLWGSCWVVFMIWLAPMRHLFNRFTGADSARVDNIISHIHLHVAKREDKRDYEFMDFLLTIGLGMAVSGIVLVIGKQWINPGDLTPDSMLYSVRTFFSGMSWVVILATLAGILASTTPISSIKGPDHMGGVLLYIVVGLIASATDFSTFSIIDAIYYVIAGFLILLFHVLILLVLAKIFRLDLYICGIASMANIGGLASAPIVAGVYDKALIPAGLVMAILGTALGTVVALLLAKLLILL